MCVCQVSLSSVKYCKYMNLDVCISEARFWFGIVKGNKKHLSRLIYMNTLVVEKSVVNLSIGSANFSLSVSASVGSPETKWYFSCFSLSWGRE